MNEGFLVYPQQSMIFLYSVYLNVLNYPSPKDLFVCYLLLADSVVICKETHRKYTELYLIFVVIWADFSFTSEIFLKVLVRGVVSVSLLLIRPCGKLGNFGVHYGDDNNVRH